MHVNHCKSFKEGEPNIKMYYKFQLLHRCHFQIQIVIIIKIRFLSYLIGCTSFLTISLVASIFPYSFFRHHYISNWITKLQQVVHRPSTYYVSILIIEKIRLCTHCQLQTTPTKPSHHNSLQHYFQSHTPFQSFYYLIYTHHPSCQDLRS